MQVFELNLDGLVGPTHHYAGLAAGNLASTTNALSPSNPKAAALQGLAKMRLLANLGLKQALLPPHQRPNLVLLYQLGFRGSPAQQIERAYREAPELLQAAYSSSFMWAANAATVSSSFDAADQRVHFTAANLVSNLHRHQEGDFAKILLERLFPDQKYFVHHPLLPKSWITADEGAANHSRLCASQGQSAVNLFVYGRQALQNSEPLPAKFPARQSLEASVTIVRSHQLDPQKVVFAQQNPEAIDAGVFHNDVIAVANEALFLLHEKAFVQQDEVLTQLQAKADFPLTLIEVPEKRVGLAEAVSTYFFNSQIVSLKNPSKMALIAPSECEENPKVKAFIEELLAADSNPLDRVHFIDLKQSMQNGGGPACLRLRIPLTQHELQAMHQGLLITDSLLDKLEAWVRRHYRDRLAVKDLADPRLVDETWSALDELSQLLDLGSIYSFQSEI